MEATKEAGAVENLLSPDEAAAVLGISVRTLERWVREGRVPFVRLGRLHKFRPASLQSWIETQEVKPVKSIVFYSSLSDLNSSHPGHINIDCSVSPHLDVKETILHTLKDHPDFHDCYVKITFVGGSTHIYNPPLNARTINE